MRRDIDLQRAVAFVLSNRIAQATRAFPLSRVHGVRDLGISIPEFMKYVEARWLPEMTWENHGQHGWHLDHIRPLSSVDFHDHEEALAAVRYENYQPLWASENRRKSVRFVGPSMPAPSSPTVRLPTDAEIDAIAASMTTPTRRR